MTKRINISILILLLSHILYAQNFSKSFLHDTENTFGILHENETLDSNGIVIYLPSMRFGLSQLGVEFSDFLVRNDNNQLFIDPSKAIQSAEAENLSQIGGRLHGLGLALDNRNFTFSFGYGIEYFTHFSYPFATLNLFTVGNTFLFGQEVDLGFDAIAQGYHKYSFGMQFSSGKITLASQLNFLSGIADVSVSENQLIMEVAPLFYGISLDNNLQINTSHLLSYSNFDNIFIDYTGDFDKSFVNSNNGFSIALAVKYDINNDNQILLKINDL